MKKLKILDFEADQEFLGAMYGAKFEAEGFEYKGYEHPPKDPENLVKLVFKEHPDLILMDITMPVMDGFMATKILKSNPLTKKIPICFLTNVGQEEDAKRAFALGATDYLIRAHYTPTEIVAAIKRILKILKTKIIIFEDEEMLRTMYVTKFQNIGFRCIAYEHPPQNLIERILAYSPDLIIMSVIMPVMDGFAATRIIKKDPRTKNIPLIFLTSCGSQEYIDHAKQLGALKYLIKAENTPSEVVEAVYDVLGIISKERKDIKPQLQEGNHQKPTLFDSLDEQDMHSITPEKKPPSTDPAHSQTISSTLINTLEAEHRKRESHRRFKNIALNTLRWVGLLPMILIAYILSKTIFDFFISRVDISLVNDIQTLGGFGGHYIFGPFYIFQNEVVGFLGACLAVQIVAPNKKMGFYALLVLYSLFIIGSIIGIVLAFNSYQWTTELMLVAILQTVAQVTVIAYLKQTIWKREKQEEQL